MDAGFSQLVWLFRGTAPSHVWFGVYWGEKISLSRRERAGERDDIFPQLN